ncbi:radical SAM protein [Myxococcota bacterium]|nr:radical SAM protein [Myxococcota bacterium]MBU1433096.1 radical SAM protein [Myxococcota bacterium]MBU1897654.1 radical SAM protein [Myxococcota bacterium]
MIQGPFENVGWTVGSHCNARCRHCYSEPQRRGAKAGLTRGEIDHIIQQLSGSGVRSVNLGGNEPAFTHGPDLRASSLPYIILKLREAGLLVGLTTNGLSFEWLEATHPEALMALNDIDFSLDAPDEATHDAHRGARLYGRTIQGIRRARALGLDCAIALCAMKFNFQEGPLLELIDLAKALDCELRVNTLKPIHPSLKAEMPSPQAFYAGFSRLLARCQSVSLGEACLSALTGAGERGCPCGVTSFRVMGKDTAGRVPVTPCVYLSALGQGDLLTEPLAEILSRPTFQRLAQRRARLPQACRDVDCHLAEVCRGGCAARALLSEGDLDAADPYCPRPLLEAGLDLGLPQIELEGATRVHDRYLCTWIGRPK